MFLFTNFEIMAASSLQARVRFFFQDTRIRLERRRELKTFLAGLFKKEGKKLDSLNIIFCSDPILLEINREFLQHDFYTDIITFDLSTSEAVTAEIYISADRVKDNADRLQVPVNQELYRVIFHGALHLCGYGDKTKAEKLNMRKKEEQYLKKYGFRFTGG